MPAATAGPWWGHVFCRMVFADEVVAVNDVEAVRAFLAG